MGKISRPCSTSGGEDGTGLMVITARKHNPGFLSINELVTTFCVRTTEYDSLIEALRACSVSANTHQMVIGRRGSGKTSLLLRVAAEIVRDSDLSARFFPVVFAEESYEVSTAGEFWLECVSRLADQVPRQIGESDLHRTFGELHIIQDDRALEDRCLGVLQDFADRGNKRLVLIVENMNMMFRDMNDDDAGWRLRKILQTEPRIVLLASATSRFDQMSNPKEALYELFRVIQLHPLDADECAALWQTVSGQTQTPQTVRALQILTGGSPRLLTTIARFGANLSFRELMANLLDLVDDHTEYFKSYLDALPAQERKVYLALADLWKPANAREIADRARLGTSKCSAHLARLIDKGAVEVSGGSARRKLYYLTERLYNIYYLMRRARGPAPLIDALIRFMEAYYSVNELKAFGSHMTREAIGFEGDTLAIYQAAFECLVGLPSLEPHREEMLSLATPPFASPPREFSTASPAPSSARELMEKALTLAEEGRLQEAVAFWDAVDRRFGTSDAPADREQVSWALINKGKALARLGKADEAVVLWNEVARRCGTDNVEGHPLAGAALVSQGGMMNNLGRHAEALATWNEIERRFGNRDEPGILWPVASALVGKCVTLARMGRPEDALEACDKALRRLGNQSGPCSVAAVAHILLCEGDLLVALNRTEDGLAAWDKVIRRFETSDEPALRNVAELALCRGADHELSKGRTIAALGLLDRALPEASAGYPDSRLQGHLIRARAHLVEGDDEACARDIERALSILSELNMLPKMSLVILTDLAVGVGPARMCDLIKSSPAADVLLPLTTALERELGLDPRVAREVEEIAEDIRRDLLESPHRVGNPT